jgi:hypothetical protein
VWSADLVPAGEFLFALGPDVSEEFLGASGGVGVDQDRRAVPVSVGNLGLGVPELGYQA